MARGPHKRWKGCAMCKPYKDDRQGQAVRQPWSTLKATGKKRRLSRHDLGDAD